ncbi:Crp/Fnr family transcriptional regulator [Streptomyces sp. CMB-StM0423]|uniref:Crp/Fnr family transcriptional regulator n=1 Tax=Streptomyces sp. CMB-StM0423 TaxID=2059884 RepID=UPI000C707634|nr:Crp/Fnr family transcriptional regulator [Streptomyces sp. CMB-StM0423]AUH40464.1 Crp/Fnr family transcriptional regulator [Streptomyces sp. CMB-StM0423]
MNAAMKDCGLHPAQVLTGRRPWPVGSFLQYLPRRLWLTLVQEWGRDARTFQHGERLALGPARRTCFIVLGGLAREERYPMGPGGGVIARFRGPGQFLGEANLIDAWSSMWVSCVGTTWVMPCPAGSVNEVLCVCPQMQIALLRSLEDRNRTDEKLYLMTSRPPLARVAMLLTHLVDTAGIKTPADPDRITINGLRQSEIGHTLQLGKSTVENALHQLRVDHKAIDSRYRQLVVTDPRALEHISRTA